MKISSRNSYVTLGISVTFTTGEFVMFHFQIGTQESKSSTRFEMFNFPVIPVISCIAMKSLQN